MSMIFFGFIIIATIVVMVWRPQTTLFFLLTTSSVKLWMEAEFVIFRYVDYTLFVCILALFMAVRNFVTHSQSRTDLGIKWCPIMFWIVLCIYLLLSLSWTSAPHYGFSKIIRMILIGISYYILGFFLVRTSKDMIMVAKTIIISGFVIALTMIFVPQTSAFQAYLSKYGSQSVGRASFLGGTLFNAASMLVTCILSSIWLIMGKELTFTWRLLAIIIIPFAVLAILASGTRAGLMALFVSYPIILFGSDYPNKWKLLLAIMGIFFLIIVALLIFQPQHVDARYVNIFSNAGDEESLGLMSRSRLWSAAFSSNVIGLVLGHGVGSFAMDIFGVDSPVWPHNVLVEAIYEGGIFSFVCLFLYLCITFFQGFQYTRRLKRVLEWKLMLIPLGGLLCDNVFALTHADLSGMRNGLLMAGMMYAFYNVLIGNNNINNDAYLYSGDRNDALSSSKASSVYMWR